MATLLRALDGVFALALSMCVPSGASGQYMWRVPPIVTPGLQV